ncbi:hypothetical protein D3C76_907820 [compost metagenome]
MTLFQDLIRARYHQPVLALKGAGVDRIREPDREQHDAQQDDGRIDGFAYSRLDGLRLTFGSARVCEVDLGHGGEPFGVFVLSVSTSMRQTLGQTPRGYNAMRGPGRAMRFLMRGRYSSTRSDAV